MNDFLILLVISMLLIACVFLYSFCGVKYSTYEPTIFNRKKFWLKELLILFNDINEGSEFTKLKISLSVFNEEKAFKELNELVNEFLKLYETESTAFICNHIRLILFRGYEKLTEKDYAQIYAIILLIYNDINKKRGYR